MEKYKFDPVKAMLGCPVVNKNGLPVKILDFNVRGERVNGKTIVGKVIYDTHEMVRQYYPDGRFNEDNTSEDLCLASNDPHWDNMLFAFCGKISDEDEYLYEEELTEFERCVRNVMVSAYAYDMLRKNNPDMNPAVNNLKTVKLTAREVLEFAKREIEKEENESSNGLVLESSKLTAWTLAERLTQLPKDTKVVFNKDGKKHLYYDFASSTLIV